MGNDQSAGNGRCAKDCNYVSPLHERMRCKEEQKSCATTNSGVSAGNSSTSVGNGSGNGGNTHEGRKREVLQSSPHLSSASNYIQDPSTISYSSQLQIAHQLLQKAQIEKNNHAINSANERIAFLNTMIAKYGGKPVEDVYKAAHIYPSGERNYYHLPTPYPGYLKLMQWERRDGFAVDFYTGNVYQLQSDGRWTGIDRHQSGSRAKPSL